MFTQPGDYMLTEEYTYPSALEAAVPMGIRPVGIRMDTDGLVPSHMDEILSSWEPSNRNGAARPKILYTVPSGQNPTGATQSLRRRRELYAVAQKHNIFILEDDPYYFLQMDPHGPSSRRAAAAAAGSAPNDTSAHDTFLAALVPSLLALDTDGRVLRMDSFSKVLFPGARCGWVTGPAQIVERVMRHNECSVQTVSGLSQLTLYKLLDETWGHEGYLSWLMHLREQYTGRRNAMLGACEKHLPKDVASWVPPAAGMFVSQPLLGLCIREHTVDASHNSSGSALLMVNALHLVTKSAPKRTDTPRLLRYWLSRIESSRRQLLAECSSCPAPSSVQRVKAAVSSSSGRLSPQLRKTKWQKQFAGLERLYGKCSVLGRLEGAGRLALNPIEMVEYLKMHLDIEYESEIRPPLLRSMPCPTAFILK